MTDERYVKQALPHKPGERLQLKLARINDTNKEITGEVAIKIIDSKGKTVSKKTMPVTLSAFDRSAFQAEISLPKKPGGYLLLAEFTPEGADRPVISRRYIKVGKIADYKFFDLQPEKLK
jgi:hypothetical protein